jgi:hypothetical protein
LVVVDNYDSTVLRSVEMSSPEVDHPDAQYVIDGIAGVGVPIGVRFNMASD